MSVVQLKGSNITTGPSFLGMEIFQRRSRFWSRREKKAVALLTLAHQRALFSSQALHNECVVAACSRGTNLRRKQGKILALSTDCVATPLLPFPEQGLFYGKLVWEA